MACRQFIQIPKVTLRRLPLQGTAALTRSVNFSFLRATRVQLMQNHFESTVTTPNISKATFLRKIRTKLGLTDIPVPYYRAMAVYLYEKIDLLPINEMFKEFKLEDTMYSWFLLMELHVWMILSRASRHGKEGKAVKVTIGSTMWEDVQRRMKLLAPISTVEQREVLERLYNEMSLALVLYDEAIQSDDRRLAEAIWTRLYRGKDVDPVVLERVVYYVRKQVLHLDTIPREEFLQKGQLTWLPFSVCKIL